MRLTKLGHSCVRLEKDGLGLVIDPGIWSGTDALAGASAVLITHEHADHIDSGVVQSALDRDAGLQLWTVPAVAAQFSGFGARVHAVGHGDAFTAAGFDVHVHGHDHAKVHPDMPAVPNIGFSADGNVFHPGDAFTIPDEPVTTLLLPISGPWLKASEMIDFARAVHPRVSYAIHDELLNDKGLGLIEMIAAGLLADAGTYARLEPGTSTDL